MMDNPRAPPETAHPSSRSAPPTTSAAGENGSGQLPLRAGHEQPLAAPSSYLRPNPPSRTMSEKTPSALDKEQLQGLVSMPIPRQLPAPPPAALCVRRAAGGELPRPCGVPVLIAESGS